MSACAIVDHALTVPKDVQRHFSRDDLRQLFTLNEDTASDTHDRYAEHFTLNSTFIRRAIGSSARNAVQTHA